MERAGAAAFNVLQAYFPTASTVAVLCGKGNNGGDGYVVAYCAHQAKLNVTVYHVGNLAELPSAAQQAYQRCHDAGVKILPFSADISLDDYEVVVDALLGIGLKNEVRDEIKQVIECINDANTEVLSLDIPSGIDADTGHVLGTAVRASVTVTFLGLKQGLLTADGLECSGDLACEELDLPSSLYESIEPAAYRLEWLALQHYFLPRSRNAHKGFYGHVLVVGGDFGMAGAVCMAGEAAARVGAGLVTVATRPQHVSAVIAHAAELMCYGIQDAHELTPLIQRASVIVVGPGLGDSTWSKACWESVLKSHLPLVVDASALQLLARNQVKRENWILTPHPGEAAQLLASNPHHIQANRFEAARSLQHQYSGVAVLKGAGTIIQTGDEPPSICTAGNPGMASAGMGDVLSGILGGLIAQHMDLQDAAELGVCLHAVAGDKAAEQGERGLLARDLIAQLRGLVN